MPTTFRYPDVEVALADADVEPLVTELAELAQTRFGASAIALVDRISIGGQRIDMERLVWGQFWALLRALDHVRNAGQLSREAQRVRDALAATGITYRLEDPTGTQGVFFSYSGPYEEGDRLVAMSKAAFRVDRTDSPESEPTLLICGEW